MIDDAGALSKKALSGWLFQIQVSHSHLPVMRLLELRRYHKIPVFKFGSKS